MLIFPEGINLAEPDQIMGGPDKPRLIEKVRSARIEQGMVLRYSDDPRFDCYAEANVDAPQIWSVFRAVCEALLGQDVTPLIGEIDEPLQSGQNGNVSELLDRFESFQFYLCHDCFLQFGFISQSPTELAEVFLTPTKQFQIWTKQGDVLREIMGQNGILVVPQLEFIDQFSRVLPRLSILAPFDIALIWLNV